MNIYDSIVIGAGPGGLTAALYLCRFGLKVALIEKLVPGGQMLNTFEVANYLGFPQGLAGWKLAENFALHLEGHDIKHITEPVVSMARTNDRYRLALDSGHVEAKTVIVCTGASPRRLNLPREQELIGKGVSYCAMCDGMFYRKKKVAMVGGGNSALEEALHLVNLVEKLYLIHRRDRFRADKIHRDKVAAHAADVIEPIMNHTITGLHGENTLTGITIEPVGGGPSRRLDVDGLFVFIGTDPAGGFLPDELECDDDGFIVTDCEMRTNLPGLFAAGDIRAKQCRQVVTAVGDGATAAYSAFDYLESLP